MELMIAAQKKNDERFAKSDERFAKSAHALQIR